VAKHHAIGYLVPCERDGCRNCASFQSGHRESSIATTRLQLCTRHGVEVTPGGICDDHRHFFRAEVEASPNGGSLSLFTESRA
jgi:hypothetical protein